MKEVYEKNIKILETQIKLVALGFREENISLAPKLLKGNAEDVNEALKIIFDYSEAILDLEKKLSQNKKFLAEEIAKESQKEK